MTVRHVEAIQRILPELQAGPFELESLPGYSGEFLVESLKEDTREVVVIHVASRSRIFVKAANFLRFYRSSRSR
jgi:hypothetical protein